MPRPLVSLAKTDRDIYGALAEEPLEDLHLFALADSAEERKEDSRSVLLRQRRVHLALRELLSGNALDEDNAARILMADPAERDRLIGAILGTPESAILPDLHTPEGVRSQYEFQRLLLASFDLLEDHNGHLGITGIDGEFHPIPSLGQIRQRLATPNLQRKMEQGFDTLLLVPFALPLARLIEAWGQGLLRNAHLLQEHGGLDRTQPVWIWEEGYEQQDGQGPDEDCRLVYFPQRFDQNHGGQTKAQLLAAAPATGWQVLLTEGALHDLPRSDQGMMIAGRPQIEAGRTPREYLASQRTGEAGWTPETYVTAFLTHLERTGQPLDAETYSYLLGSYLPGPGGVPYAFWLPGYRKAYLDGDVPGLRSAGGGVRGAVGVV